jgi:5-methyltetrahydropteroyltriglutamate--homocysteine methyltransferase
MARITGTQNVLLPTTQVGAYPRPIWMEGRPIGDRYGRDFEDMTARAKFEDATLVALVEQERAGLDLPTDGQQYYEPQTKWDREPVFNFVASRIGGVDFWGPPGPMFFDVLTQFRIVDKLEWVRPIYGPVADTVRSLTERPVKVQMIGPATMSFLLSDEYYKDIEGVAADMALIYQRELDDLARRGVQWVSFVEEIPLWSGGLPWTLKCLNDAVRNAPVKTSWHSCYGASRGVPAIMEDGCAAVYGPMFANEEILVDDISFEFSRRDYKELDVFRPFAERPGKTVSVGVINPMDMTVETPEQVRRAVQKAVSSLGAENVIVSTDCGLLFLRRDVAYSKLKSLVEGTRLARKELGAA